MYAVVRSGGQQHKVAVGDTLEVDRVAGGPGTELRLPAVLLVDGTDVTSAPDALAGVAVAAEVVEHTRGPKLRVNVYRNKTGYRRRKGFRADRSVLRVTDIARG